MIDIFDHDIIEYDKDGDRLIGEVTSHDKGKLECTLMYPSKSMQPGSTFVCDLNTEENKIKKMSINKQKYDKHKSQYTFNKDSGLIEKDEEAIKKLAKKYSKPMDRISELSKKYSKF